LRRRRRKRRRGRRVFENIVIVDIDDFSKSISFLPHF
jgi:hypothetical protein